jgi:anti-sigma regulatory factor (Ser/Thr protein kinase)
MSTSPPPFAHRAFFYDDTADFLAGLVPFVQEGLDQGDGVLVAVDRAKAEALRRALPHANGALHFADMAVLGRNPGRIISAWADFVREQTEEGRGVRGIGEPVWRGRTEPELVECQRHEALLNVAFAGQSGFTLVCPYDRTMLDDAVLAEAARSHPELTADGATGSSPTYVGHVEPVTGALPEPTVPVARLEFSEHLGHVRRQVSEHTARAGMDEDRAADLLVAVTEATTNSIRHGAGGGVLRIWRQDARVVCEVADDGRRIEDPLAGRFKAGPEETGGRGLWLIHQLCDLVEVRSSDQGNLVRMHVHC